MKLKRITATHVNTQAMLMVMSKQIVLYHLFVINAFFSRIYIEVLNNKNWWKVQRVFYTYVFSTVQIPTHSMRPILVAQLLQST